MVESVFCTRLAASARHAVVGAGQAAIPSDAAATGLGLVASELRSLAFITDQRLSMAFDISLV